MFFAIAIPYINEFFLTTLLILIIFILLTYKSKKIEGLYIIILFNVSSSYFNLFI